MSSPSSESVSVSVKWKRLEALPHRLTGVHTVAVCRVSERALGSPALS